MNPDFRSVGAGSRPFFFRRHSAWIAGKANRVYEAAALRFPKPATPPAFVRCSYDSIGFKPGGRPGPEGWGQPSALLAEMSIYIAAQAGDTRHANAVASRTCSLAAHPAAI